MTLTNSELALCLHTAYIHSGNHVILTVVESCFNAYAQTPKWKHWKTQTLYKKNAGRKNSLLSKCSKCVTPNNMMFFNVCLTLWVLFDRSNSHNILIWKKNAFINDKYEFKDIWFTNIIRKFSILTTFLKVASPALSFEHIVCVF